MSFFNNIPPLSDEVDLHGHVTDPDGQDPMFMLTDLVETGVTLDGTLAINIATMNCDQLDTLMLAMSETDDDADDLCAQTIWETINLAKADYDFTKSVDAYRLMNRTWNWMHSEISKLELTPGEGEITVPKPLRKKIVSVLELFEDAIKPENAPKDEWEGGRAIISEAVEAITRRTLQRVAEVGNGDTVDVTPIVAEILTTLPMHAISWILCFVVNARALGFSPLCFVVILWAAGCRNRPVFFSTLCKIVRDGITLYDFAVPVPYWWLHADNQDYDWDSVPEPTARLQSIPEALLFAFTQYMAVKRIGESPSMTLTTGQVHPFVLHMAGPEIGQAIGLVRFKAMKYRQNVLIYRSCKEGPISGWDLFQKPASGAMRYILVSPERLYAIPWNVRLLAKKTVDGKRIHVYGSRLNGTFRRLFVITLLLCFVAPSFGATMVETSQTIDRVGMWAAIFAICVQFLLWNFPAARKYFRGVVEVPDDDRDVESLSRPVTKKWQDGEKAEYVPSDILQAAKSFGAKQGMAILFAKSAHVRSVGPPFELREIDDSHVSRFSQRMRATVLGLSRSRGHTFDEWFVKTAAKGHFPSSWIPVQFTKDIAEEVRARAVKSVGKHDRLVTRISMLTPLVEKITNMGVRATVSTPTALGFADNLSLQRIAHSCGHPVVSLLMHVQRALLTNWMKQAKGVAKASIAADFAVAILQVYNCLPKTRWELLNLALSTVTGTLVFNNTPDGPSQVDTGDSSWSKMIACLSCDWASAREGTKYLASKFLAFVATLPVLWSEFTTADNWRSAIVSSAGKIKNHTHVASVIDFVFDSIEFCASSVAMGRFGIGARSLFTEVEAKYTVLNQAFKDFVYYSKGEPITLTERTKQLIDDYTALQRTVKATVEIKHCTDRLIALQKIERDIVGKRDSMKRKYMPQVIAYSGAPGVGKSIAMGAAADIWMNAIGVRRIDGTHMETDPFDSNIDPSTTVVSIDDAGKTQVDFLKAPVGDFIIRMCTNDQTPLIKAVAEEKGNQFAHMMLITQTSNETGCRNGVGLVTPAAVDRRVLEWHVEPDETKATLDPATKTWIPKEPQAIPEPSHLLFYRVTSSSKDAGHEYQRSTVPLSWEQHQRELEELAKKHHARELAILSSDEKPKTRCEHGRYSLNCDKCSSTFQNSLADSISGRIVTYASHKYQEIYDTWFPGYTALSDIEHDRCMALRVICILVLLASLGLNLFLWFSGPSFCFIMSGLCFLAVDISFLVESRNQQALAVASMPDREQAVETAASSPASPLHHFALGGLTLAAFISVVAWTRRCKFQSCEIVTEPDEPQEDSGDGEGEKVATQAGNDEVSALVKKVKDYKEEKIPLTVPDLKALHKNEQLVSELSENYWVAPTRVHPVSQAGSGANNETLADAVRSQMYFMRESYGPKKYRICFQVCSGVLLMNTHVGEKLEDKVTYTLVQNYKGQRHSQRIQLDVSSISYGPENTDWCLVRCTPIKGGAQRFDKYMVGTHVYSSNMEGLLVSPLARDSEDQEFVVHKSSTTVKPKGREYLVGKCLVGIFTNSLPIKAYDGLCGAVQVVNKCIVGIHSFGSIHERSNNSGGTLISRDAFLEALAKISTAVPDDMGPRMSYRTKALQIVEAHPKNPTNFIPTGMVPYYFSVERTFSLRTALEPNPYAPLYEEALGEAIVGRFAPAAGSFNKVAHKMMLIAVAFRGEPMYRDLMDAAAEFLVGMEDVVAKAFKHNPNLLRTPMCVSQAVAGIAGHEYEHGINPNKSAGFPWMCSKSNFMELTPGQNQLKAKFGAELQEVLFAVQSGRSSGMIGQVLGKDEPLPYKEERFGDIVTKVLKDKRGFVGCNMHLQIITKMYLGPVMAVMQEANIFFCNAVGIDPGGEEWDYMVDHMTHRSDAWLSVDQPSYDLTHGEALNQATVKVFSEVAKAIGYSETEVRMVELIAYDLQHMYVNFSGPIVKLWSLWPSGIPPTAIAGALKTVLMMSAAFKRYYPSEKVRDCMDMVALGDDNVVAAVKGKPRLTTAQMKLFYEECGMGLTADDKSEEITWATSFNDVQFLSRTNWFHPELQRNVGKLKMDSILKPLSVWAKTSHPLESLADIATSSMREAALHGREFFERMARAHKIVFEKLEYPPPTAVTVEYDDYIEAMIERNAVVRKRSKFQNQFEPEEGADQTVEIREVVEPGPVETNELSTLVDWSRYRVQLPEKTLPSLVYREILLGTSSLPIDIYFSVSFNPLESLMENELIRSRLDTYTAFQFDIVVRFAVSATSFHYGKLIAHAVHQPSMLDFQNDKALPHDFRICLASQRRGVEFGIGDGEKLVELRIPFFYHHTAMRMTRQVVANYVDLRVDSITPLRVARADITSPATLSVYARFENIRVLGHTTKNYQNTAPEEGRPKPSVMLANAARVAQVAGNIPALAVPAEIAAGVLHGASTVARALGHSRPIDYGGPPFVPFLTAPLGNANTDVAGRVLSYDVMQNVAVDGRLSGQGVHDELRIDYLCAIPTIVATGRLRTNESGVGTEILHMCVTPGILLQNNPNLLLTPTGLVSSFRELWHGTMVYDFELVTTGLTGGKVMINYEANGPGLSAGTERTDNFVMDIKASKRVRIMVEWHSHKNFLRTWTVDQATPLNGTFDEEVHNGAFSISILQPIVGSRTDQSIDWILRAHMVKADFAVPSFIHLSNKRIVGTSGGRRLNGGTPIPSDNQGNEPDPDPIDQDGLLNVIGIELGPAGRFLSRIPTALPFMAVANTVRPPRVFRRLFRRRAERRNASTLPVGPPLSFDGVVGSPGPGSSAPTPMPQSMVPTKSPNTMVPTAAPVQMTNLPTAGPTLRPSFAVTDLPTAAPSCENQLQVVPYEWAGARGAIYYDGTQYVVGSNNTINLRTIVYTLGTGASSTAIIEMKTQPRALSANVSHTLTTDSIRFEIATTAGLSQFFASIDFEPNTVFESLSVTLPASSHVVELTPADIAAQFGLALASYTSGSGVTYSAASLPQGEVLTLPLPNIADTCPGTGSGAAQISYRGTIRLGDGTEYTSLGNEPWVTPVFGGTTVEAVTNVQILSVSVIERKNVFQNTEVDGPDPMFHIGEPLNILEPLSRVHTGEVILSLRWDLRVFRPNMELAVAPQGGLAWEATLHSCESLVTTPYEVLQYCFGGIRGSVYSLYVLYGDGYGLVQRGQIAYRGGIPASDLQRGYERVDTRVNPSLLVRYPYQSDSQFDFGRGAYAGTNLNLRNISVYNTGNDEMRVTEDIATGEDFDLFYFLGCPVMTRL